MRFGAVRRFAILAVFAMSAWMTGCSAAPGPAATPTATATPAASPTPTVLPTPRPTSTPYATVEPPAPSGRVTARLIVSCDLGAYGMEVRVRYGGSISDTDDPAATITGVQVYVDGSLREDSGPLSHRIYVREARFRGHPNGIHRILLHIETWGAPQPADLLQVAQCPPAPAGPVA